NSQFTTNSLNIIVSISFIDTNNGWAIVDSIAESGEDFFALSTIIHTTDGGATWVTQLRDTTVGIINVIQFVDADNGWVVGDEAKILRTTNGGNTWTPVTNSGIADSSTNDALFFLDANIGWISSDDRGPNRGVVLHTTDGGATWSTQNSGLNSRIFGVHFIDGTTGWVAADGGGIAHTTDGGMTWAAQSSSVTNNELNDVFALPDGVNLWAVGENGTILHTTDGGSVWEIQTSDLTDRVASVFFVDDQVGWAVGGGPNISGIVRTSDGGDTWVSQITFTGDLYSVLFLNANEGWAAGTGGLMLHTTDAGSNWVNQTSGTSNLLRSVFFVDQNFGWAVGENGSIIHTNDGGTNWTNQFSGTANHLRDVSFTDATTGTAVGLNGTVIRTTDAGANWILLDTGTESDVHALVFVDADTGHAVGRNGTIFYTTDGGQNWTNQVSGTGQTLRGVAFSDPGTGTVVGYNGTILRTTTGGVVVSVGETGAVVTNHEDSGFGSLREAIEFANGHAGPDTIIFNIPTSDPGFDGTVFTIQPLSPLPALTDDGTFIDGSTQTAFTGNTNPAGPEVVLNGDLAGFVGGGLNIHSSYNTIHSLVINGFNNTGIVIKDMTANWNLVTGCFLGTDPTGTAPVGNVFDGITLRNGAENNLIGGSTAAERNLISGNGRNGVLIWVDTNNNIIQGNFIGTDISGTLPLGNSAFGVQIGEYAHGNIVGGTGAGEGNLISGNGLHGVGMLEGSSANLVKGNFVGTDVTGTMAIANGDGDDSLGIVLADDVAIQGFDNLARGQFLHPFLPGDGTKSGSRRQAPPSGGLPSPCLSGKLIPCLRNA
ncbi:MAG: hypothetical protein IH914_10405, partial [candidate division Zixibacteria bacterium]|nr:hypothetical protein [candidate division Zixibacteria bacterium]